MAENKNRLAHTIPGACDRLGLSRTTFYGLIQTGEIRTFKVGARTLVPESELVSFIDRKMKEAA